MFYVSTMKAYANFFRGDPLKHRGSSPKGGVRTPWHPLIRPRLCLDAITTLSYFQFHPNVIHMTYHFHPKWKHLSLILCSHFRHKNCLGEMFFVFSQISSIRQTISPNKKSDWIWNQYQQSINRQIYHFYTNKSWKQPPSGHFGV
jgi:hypothetical protein